jgi:hypothetical protein
MKGDRYFLSHVARQLTLAEMKIHEARNHLLRAMSPFDVADPLRGKIDRLYRLLYADVIPVTEAGDGKLFNLMPLVIELLQSYNPEPVEGELKS